MTTPPPPAPPGASRFGLPLGLLVVLAGLGTVAPLATDMYLPSLPQIATDFGTSATATQLTLSGFMIGLGLGQILLGTLSDRWGRKRILMAGTAMLTVASALCAIAPTIELFIGARFLEGLSGAAGMVVGRAVAADLTEGRSTARVYSLLGVIGGVAPAVAPASGALVAHLGGWRMVFWLLTVLAALMFAGAWLVVPESLPPERRQGGGLGRLGTTARDIISDRTFVGYCLTLWFAFGVMFAYISSSPFVVQRVLGLSTGIYTLVFGLNALGLMLSGTVSVALVRRYGPRRLLRFGVAGISLGALTMLVAALADLRVPGVVLPALSVIALSMPMIMGNATALAIQRARHAAGTALAMMGSVQFAVASVVSPLVSLDGQDSLLAPALTMIASAALCVLGLLLARSTSTAQEV